MAQTKHLSDFLELVDPLIADIMKYELRIRGIQPAQANTTKKSQLANALYKEYQGNGFSFDFYLTPANDLRECSSLYAQFEGHLTSGSRNFLSVKNVIKNLLFLGGRVQRINCTSLIETNAAKLLFSNINNCVINAERLLASLNNTPSAQAEIIDLSNDSPRPPTQTPIYRANPFSVGPRELSQFESGVFEQLFASIDLNSTTNEQAQQATMNNNRTDNVNSHNRQHTFIPTSNITYANNSNAFPMHSFPQTQSHFNQNIPMSSTNANPHVTSHNHNSFNNHIPDEMFNTYPQNEQSLNYGPNNLRTNQRDFNHHSQPSHSRSTYLSQRRDHKIYKWNVKFSGEEKNSNAIDFIQKVNAIAQSRGVTDAELFESAIEFFTGHALKWYYAQRNQISSWAELAEKLISDFVEVHYYDNLLDTIRQRIQKQNEAIVHFFTVFEDDCSRLQTLLTPAEKIHIMKKNVLIKYRPYITLKSYETLNELKHDLKLLEASMLNNGDRNVSFEHTNYRRSRYDDFRGNRSFSRSPSNDNGTFRRDSSQNRSQFKNEIASSQRDSSHNRSQFKNRPSTPKPYENGRNNSRDRTDTRSKSPFTERRRNESFDRNTNTRSHSRDSNSSQRKSNVSKHLNY